MEKAKKVAGGSKTIFLRSIYKVLGLSPDAFRLSLASQNHKMGNISHLVDEKLRFRNSMYLHKDREKILFLSLTKYRTQRVRMNIQRH